MTVRADFEESLKEAFRSELAKAEPPLPKSLADRLRAILLAPGKRTHPRLLLACADMVHLRKEAALPAALAVEMLQAYLRTEDPLRSALLPMSIGTYLQVEPHVESKHLLAGLHRLVSASGLAGMVGGEAEEKTLDTESTLDDLRQTQARRTGAVISASLLIPKDLNGIADDSSEGLALEIFSKELGLALGALEDLEVATEEPGANQLLRYVPIKEAKRMTLQRLNSASLTLSSAWGASAQLLVHFAEETARKIEGIGDE